MGGSRLVIVATYDEVYKAELAKTALEEEGIAAVLHDREIVAMEWILSNAVGGVKVKVPEADGERALRILAEKPSDRSAFLESGKISEEELTRQALAEPSEEGLPESVAEAAPAADWEPGSAEELASITREDYARRFLRTSAFSILFWPLCFYAVYLGLNAVFSRGRLSSEGQKRIFYGLVACGLSLVFSCFALRYFGGFLGAVEAGIGF